MDATHYLYAWMIYLASAAGCFLVWYRMTRICWRWLRWFLRGFALVLLFTPWYVNVEQDYLGPAFLIAGFDGLTLGLEAIMRAGHVLLAALAVMIVLWVLALVLIPAPAVRPKKKPKGKVAPESRPKKRAKQVANNDDERITPTL
ncbi:hypothetical protein [Zooshikella ganghwensis]|uniref:MFS transporter n=2 Tax=Zooshikella ganghwensis TaxID=202772 RepID=A0A4P9VN20_9GAMM|nr:hypothetical protein [Zooshikella ganghwensis]RDH43500.1 MFS transporter [Zooshikella ganghwensis]